MLRERKAYIVLVVICIALCLGVFLLSVQTAMVNDKKFCQVLVIQTQYPEPKPTKNATLVQEKAWRIYQGRLELTHDLGC